MRRLRPDETLAHGVRTEARGTVVLTPGGHRLIPRPRSDGVAPLTVGRDVVVGVARAHTWRAVGRVVVTILLAPRVSCGVACPGSRASTRVSSWDWRCNDIGLSGRALGDSLSGALIVFIIVCVLGRFIVIIILRCGDTIS